MSKALICTRKQNPRGGGGRRCISGGGSGSGSGSGSSSSSSSGGKTTSSFQMAINCRLDRNSAAMGKEGSKKYNSYLLSTMYETKATSHHPHGDVNILQTPANSYLSQNNGTKHAHYTTVVASCFLGF